MNKLNPVYILALVLVLLLVSFMSLNEKKDEFKSANKSYEQMKVTAKDFKSYKKDWFDKKAVERKVRNIVKSSSFRSAKILHTQVGKIIKVKIESNNPKLLNRFLRKVLNEKIVVNKLQVEKKSIYLEVGLK